VKVGATDAGAPDGSSHDASPPVNDSGSGPVACNGPDNGGACPRQLDTSKILAFKPPTTGPGSCSDADLQAIATTLTAISTGTANYLDAYNATQSATCRACVFSQVSDSHWQPIVWKPSMGPCTAFQNFGACYMLASTNGTTCGQAGQEAVFCYDAVCPPACANQACSDAASTGACKTYVDTFISECGGGATFSQVDMACSTVLKVLQSVCGQKDGG
jgi:hypothetical protein